MSVKFVAVLGLGVVLSGVTGPVQAAVPAAGEPERAAVGAVAAAGTRGAIAPTAAGARTTSARTVVVHGHARKARGTARIERRTAGRWALVARAAVRHHKYAARVTQPTSTASYRAVVAGRVTRPSVVALKPTATTTTTPVASATPTRTSTAATPVVTGCGGVVLRKADGTPWVCTFDDEFDGTALDRTRWVPQTDFVTGTPQAHACYRDDPSNVSVGGGTLNLTVRKESTPIRCANTSMGATADYSSGMVSTYHLFSQKYGRFETRFKVPATTAPGLQEDFWLWPDDRDASNLLWPAAGEIDVAELYSQYYQLNVPFLHYTWYDNWGPRPGLNTSWTCAAARGSYNTYTLEWTASQISIAVNGKTCLVNKSGDVAFQRRYIMAFTQALGTGTNAVGTGTPIPSTMNVDYVRVWS
jgi:beta-glucanase (GH16 family)